MEPETITALIIPGALFLFLLVVFILDRKTASLAAAIPEDLRINYGIFISQNKLVAFMLLTAGGVILSGINMENPALQITIRILGVVMLIFGVGMYMKAPVKILCSSAELPQLLKSYSRWALALSFFMILLFGFNIFFRLSH